MRLKIFILLLVLLPALLQSNTIKIPEDYQLIQDGITHAQNGDTILVADGIYTGEGNGEIRFFGKKITLKSENGPEYVILQGFANWPFGASCFNIIDGEDSNSVIDGFTVADWQIFEGHPGGEGAGIHCGNSSPIIKNCIFYNNKACDVNGLTGGATAFLNSKSKIMNCTFVNNRADCGSVLFSHASSVEFHNCVIAFNIGSEPNCGNQWGTDSIYMPRLYNCNVFGNQNTEWIYPYISENELNVDPMFCDSSNNDFTLQSNSPCLPENNDYNALIGALGEGCATTDVEELNSSDNYPGEFQLLQNYPNPCNSSTLIAFSLPRASYVTMDIYNVLGRKIRTLINERLPAGHKRVIWDGKDDIGHRLASGIYFYRLKCEEFSESRKMLYLK